MVKQAAIRFPDQSTGFFLQGDDLYQISVTPLYVDSTHGQALQNVLVAGYRVDALVAQQLKQRTNSEFLVRTPGAVIASTLNPRATGRGAGEYPQDRASEPVSDGVLEYARLDTPLLDIAGKPVGEICILRSFEGPQRRISQPLYPHHPAVAAWRCRPGSA